MVPRARRRGRPGRRDVRAPLPRLRQPRGRRAGRPRRAARRRARGAAARRRRVPPRARPRRRRRRRGRRGLRARAHALFSAAFGQDNGLTVEYLGQNEAFYSEYVEAYLNRAARWLLDRTKADGLRLDAVKHIPADFFGATFGADIDRSNYGYLGQAQEQFNLTRGFSDWDNHRDTVFDTERPRDDAMMFGEHLGSPPAVDDYINAGMRLLDNDLRHHLNSQLGNPWGTLAGMDASGSYGFAPGSSIMHAQSHDSDYAARRELQHALYLTRGGIGIIYSDGNHKAGILKGSGGAFPRHANTNFLGQWGDNRIPNLLYFHEHFARGYQVGRWSDGDVVVYERVDKRDNPAMTDAAGTVGLVMINDNYFSSIFFISLYSII